MSAIQKTKWRSVFTRVEDTDNGEPRFYIRGTRSHLFGYDGYTGTHPKLNEILDFLGGNKKGSWTGSDSPMNVSNFEYVDEYWNPEDHDDLEDEGIDNRIEIYAGNYMFCEPSQGAYIVGFTLLRALTAHFGLSKPRKLKRDIAK